MVTERQDVAHDAAGTKEQAAEAGRQDEKRLALPTVCWLFLGLGVYRAWIEVCFVGSFVDFPTVDAGRNLFDLACAVVLLACAAWSRRIAPLFRRRALCWAACAAMVAAGALRFAGLWLPGIVDAVAVPASLLGGVGTAVIILLWSELYGCLNPVRIALYYALSQLVGAAIIWTLRGFAMPWLAFYACLLPIASFAMVFGAFKRLPGERLPEPTGARFSFPWKPAALVCVYAFAFGLQEANTYAFCGPHSGPGMVLAALTVVVGIALLSRIVEFGTIYSLWLPCMMMAALLISLVGVLGPFLTSFFVGLSYGAAELFVMTMVGSICYRYGANALWLFGIERAVRMLAMFLGRSLEGLAAGLPVAAIVVLAAAVGTLLIISEKRLTSDWGVVLYEEGEDLLEAARRNALGRRCAELGRAHGLTEREEEVLLLLAQHKTAGDIERELCVAYGTAKAHIRHVYRKLDIHSREELFDLVAPAEGSVGV